MRAVTYTARDYAQLCYSSAKLTETLLVAQKLGLYLIHELIYKVLESRRIASEDDKNFEVSEKENGFL